MAIASFITKVVSKRARKQWNKSWYCFPHWLTIAILIYSSFGSAPSATCFWLHYSYRHQLFSQQIKNSGKRNPDSGLTLKKCKEGEREDNNLFRTDGTSKRYKLVTYHRSEGLRQFLSFSFSWVNYIVKKRFACVITLLSVIVYF